MNRKIRCRTALLLSVLFLLCFEAAGASGTETHIRKRIAALGESCMDIDMAAPAPPPAAVPRIKLERVKFKRGWMTEILDRYRPAPQKGESWEYEISSSLNPDFGLIWCEEDGLYGPFWCEESSPHIPLDETDESLRRADETARAFLDELGLPYEYPFYVVAPWHEPFNDDGLIRIAARLTIDGIPCNTTIGWTPGSDGGGNGDPVPGVFLNMTRDGKLGAAIIRNPVTVTERLEDMTPIRDWESILEADKDRIMQQFCTGDDTGSTLTLRQVQFVMMADARQNAYPAWVYCFDHYVPADPHCSGPICYDMLLTYDARTGNAVW